MTKTKKPFDPNAFNYHSHYTGVVICSLIDIEFGFWDDLPCDDKENDGFVLEWIEQIQERLNRDSIYSPAEAMDPAQILEIATQAADHLNYDRMYDSRLEISPHDPRGRYNLLKLKSAESVH